MKALALLSLLCTTPAQAMFIDCRYQPEPCDEQGNHYFCEYYGWAMGEFCAPNDRSVRPPFRPFPRNTQRSLPSSTQP